MATVPEGTLPQPPRRTRVKRKEEKAASACTPCRRDHASCDNGN
jgi:hypothetical protein